MGLENKIMFLDQLEGKLCPKSGIFGKFGGRFEKNSKAIMKVTFFEKKLKMEHGLEIVLGQRKMISRLKILTFKSMTQPKSY